MTLVHGLYVNDGVCDSFLSENVERKQIKEGKTWRTKLADKFRQTGVSAVESADSIQPPRVFGVSLEKSVPSNNNEVCDYELIKNIYFCHC